VICEKFSGDVREGDLKAGLNVVDFGNCIGVYVYAVSLCRLYIIGKLQVGHEDDGSRKEKKKEMKTMMTYP